MTEAVPPWLLTMRSMMGMAEVPGSGENPKIRAMADQVAQIFPDMRSYCDQYRSETIPWCGLTVADCMALANIRPPFGPTDTQRFLWARSWANDGGYVQLKLPRLGAIVVLTRSGGGHVSLYESTNSSGQLMLRGGNQSDAITLAPFSKANVIGYFWPRDAAPPEPIIPPAHQLPVLRKGSKGPDVVYLQTILPKEIDGDFGSTTEALVKSFQKSEGLEVDGIVGEQTWAKLLDEEPPPPPQPGGVLFHAVGKCSWFGGPDDTGVQPDEGLAFIQRVEQAPELFLPYQPPMTSGLARRLDPSVLYIAVRWDYSKTPRDMLLSETAHVRATESGREIECFPADWGPNVKTGRVADLSPGALEALGIETDDEVEVTFPTPPSVDPAAGT